MDPDESTTALTDSRLTLNLRGTRFQIDVTDLGRCPRGRLAKLTKTERHYDEYVFNRNPQTFQAILDYYTRGTLHFPGDLCHNAVKEELEFWTLPPEVLAPCCLEAYQRAEEEAETVSALQREILEETGELSSQGFNGRSCRMRTWRFLEYPKSSIPAYVWSLAVYLLIILSVVGFGIEMSLSQILSNEDVLTRKRTQDVITNVMVAVEILTVTVLSVDVILRAVVSPNKRRFFCNLLNILQILITAPLWVITILVLVYPNLIPPRVLMMLRIFPLLRVFLLFRMTKNSWRFKILCRVVAGSLRDVGILLGVALVIAGFFGFCEFLAEYEDNSGFFTVFNAMWWAIVTMTTVGYGDVHPMTVFGKVLACVCALSGVFVLAVLFAVVGANFRKYQSDVALYGRYKKNATRVGRDSTC